VEPFGDEYLLAYSGQEIAGTAITGSVLLVSASGEVTAEYDPVVEGMLTASAAANSDQMLFSWQDAATEGLMGRLLHRTDGWGEPFVLTDQVAEGAPAICWDGTAFVVAWGESRAAMWSRNVAADGSLTEPERLFVGDYGWPRLALGADGQMLFSYVRWLEGSRSRRIESRLAGVLGDGVDELPADDATGGMGGASPTGTGGAGAQTGGTGGAGTGGVGTGGGAAQTDGTGGTPTTGQAGAGTTTTVGTAGTVASTPSTGGTASTGTASITSEETPNETSTGDGTQTSSEESSSESAQDSSAAGAGATEGGEAPGSANRADDGCSVSNAGMRGSGLGWLSVLVAAVAWRRRYVVRVRA
jgi:MYXO-CTERM domain-containing protein